MWDNKRGRLCVRWWEGSSVISDWLRGRETEGQVRGLWSVIDHFGLTDGHYFVLCQTRRKTEMEADGVRVMESGLMLTREDEVPQQCNNLLFPHPWRFCRTVVSGVWDAHAPPAPGRLLERPVRSACSHAAQLPQSPSPLSPEPLSIRQLFKRAAVQVKVGVVWNGKDLSGGKVTATNQGGATFSCT